MQRRGDRLLTPQCLPHGPGRREDLLAQPRACGRQLLIAAPVHHGPREGAHRLTDAGGRSRQARGPFTLPLIHSKVGGRVQRQGDIQGRTDGARRGQALAQ